VPITGLGFYSHRSFGDSAVETPGTSEFAILGDRPAKGIFRTIIWR